MVVSLNSRLESNKEEEKGLRVDGTCSIWMRLKAHRLWYHSLEAQGPSRTCNESKKEEEVSGLRVEG